MPKLQPVSYIKDRDFILNKNEYNKRSLKWQNIKTATYLKQKIIVADVLEFNIKAILEANISLRVETFLDIK